MSDLLRVSFSRIKSWRRCHLQHYYKYVDGIERKKPPISMYKGRIVHDLLEAILLGKSWTKKLEEYAKQYKKLFREERDELGDLPGDMKRIIIGYLEFWKNDHLKYLEVEKKHEIKLGKNMIFVFRLDGIVQDKKKRRWIFERKTPKKFPDEDVRLADLQTLLYTWAMQQEGVETEGVLWDYVRSKAPTIPEPLKAGGLSVAQNIDTDYNTYLAAIKRHRLNPKDYREKLESLKGAEANFYRRVPMVVSPSVVKTLVEDMMQTALEIQQDSKSRVRTLSFDCRGCQYFQLCQAELRDMDTDFIRKSQYTKTETDLDEKETPEE
jgi:hypothetical protein